MPRFPDSRPVYNVESVIIVNYFAHGLRFLDRPYFLAGTAIPDWLSVADRRVRMRERLVIPFADASGTPQAEIAAGVLQHLHDDNWFHKTRGFAELTAEVAALFRSVLGNEDGFRPGFLGHIATELLLDAALISRGDDQLDRYYSVMSTVDPNMIEDVVNQMAKNQTDRLALVILAFRHVQFLRDYVDSSRLLYRLNQVMSRVKLPGLPDEIEQVLETARQLVKTQVHTLLPPEHFTYSFSHHSQSRSVE